MPIQTKDISKIRNKQVRSDLNQKRKKDLRQAKLKKRIARKEAEARGEHVEKGIPRTIENTREWLGDEDGEDADPRTRPAPVTVDDQTGDVNVDMGSLSNLFPMAPPPQPTPSGFLPPDAKVLITTSPGKPPAPFTKQFLDDLQALLGGKKRADVVPRRSPKFELGRVARWARKRGYGAIMVVGEDHAKPTTMTMSLLPYGPTSHFRLSGITLCKDIPGHASPTSHPPELVLNHFATPLGLSLATLLSQLFLPPGHAEVLQRQGFQGRQVVLAQNSRDFVFVRRYRYMFALKSHRLGKTKKQTDVPRMTDPHPEHDADDTIKTRFQEIGPQMTLKMRWIRRGPLGETGDERTARERFERETGERAEEFGERAEGAGEEEEGAEDGMDVDGEGEANAGAGASDEEGDDEADEDADAAEEAEARRAIGLDASDAAGQPNFPRPAPSASSSAATASTSAHPSASPSTSSPSSAPPAPAPESKKRPRTTPRVRKKPYHALLNPPPSDSPSPEPEEVPLPTVGKKKNPALQSAIETVGKTWHAGKGEGGVREGAKRREWNWEAKMQVSRRKFFL
ncbi:anticodon-binding protein [Rhodotorula diobovata]|uniref:Anticodon-binding protein n=1 Tax=Rhodotorula diobovata TaxID=5288 RepID=A0A5C5FXQ6_9BASI|nr:anticodon-binding protein [Rhodotorula diobovata]